MTHVPTMSDDVEERSLTGTAAIAKVTYMTKPAGRLIIGEVQLLFFCRVRGKSRDAYTNKHKKTRMTNTNLDAAIPIILLLCIASTSIRLVRATLPRRKTPIAVNSN